MRQVIEKLTEKKPNGTSTNPRNFDLNKNFHLIGTQTNLDSRKHIMNWNLKLKFGYEIEIKNNN